MRLPVIALCALSFIPLLKAQTAAGTIYYSGGSLPSAASMNGQTIIAKSSDASGNAGSGTYVLTSNGTSWSGTAVGGSGTFTAPAAGIVKSDGTNLSAATAGTDYLSPTTGVKSLNGQVGTLTVGAGLVKSTGTGAALTTATAGTDYLTPSGAVTSLNAQTGALTIGAGLVKSTGTGAALTTATAGTDYMSTSTAVTTTQLPAIAKGRTCELHIWGSGTSSALTTTTDNEPYSCLNDSSSTMTITSVKCLADNSSTTTTVTPIVQGGTSTSILTGALTCGNATFSSGTLNGTPTLAAAASINAQISAGGTAKSVRLIITGTY